MPSLASMIFVGFVSSCVLATSAAEAQGNAFEKAFCIAPTPGSAEDVLWLGAGDSSTVGYRPTPTAIVQRISGTWELLSVATEGTPSPHADRSMLRLVPTDSVARTRCPIGRCQSRFSYPAAGQLLRGDASFDSVAAVRHRASEETDVGVSYNVVTNELQLSFGPPAFDAGDIYTISIFADTAFAGRWVSGGYFYLDVKRGGVTTFEKPGGYFCARRVRR